MLIDIIYHKVCFSDGLYICFNGERSHSIAADWWPFLNSLHAAGCPKNLVKVMKQLA